MAKSSRFDWRPTVHAVLERSQVARDLLQRSGRASFAVRVDWDAVPYPHYAYGLLQAALQAQGLSMAAISAGEFGVARGHGLVALERHAAEVQQLTGVRVQTLGFDTGE